MASVCGRCGRPRDNSRNEKTGKRKRNRDHICPMVTIRRKKIDDATQQHTIKIVNEARVAKGGDLHELVTGRKAPWEVVYRDRQGIENIIENYKSKKKKDGDVLVAPSGEPLSPPSKG